ncbi:MAG TPA: phosphoesterase RecJ domain-containing protein [Clostridiales bacterium]|nr:phosphoesterase RecJ domain-containing protein [Clostridiales bacterium]
MKKLRKTEAAAFLVSHDHYAILTHRRPDGDTLGCGAALCRGLRKLGKTAYILENPEISDRFRWLHMGLTKETAETGDTVVSVDVASPSMLPACFQSLQGSIALRIDHHASATSFTQEELVDAASASCAEIVWDVLEEMGVEPDRDIAEAVYVGVSTDTGCFRYANTDAHTFLTAAKCAQAGARIYELNQELFETNTLAKLKMQGWIVEHMQMLAEGKMAICAIPRQVELDIGVTQDDMDNISSFPRTVAGVCIAATLRETGEGDVKISVRAIPGYDATRVTEPFGGGGHKGAAGASLKMSLEDAASAVEKAMLELA